MTTTRNNGIYVEIPMQVSLDALWEHTQNPALHEQWDLRFTDIEYLPKTDETEPQRFLYQTRIGFGLNIAGEGESVGTRHKESGESTSALKFWSDMPISLISKGSGYWKYIPEADHIRFITWYDYDVRFGTLGHWFDQLLFRPLMGWATAWSFDALRLWLERGISPRLSRQQGLIHLLIQLSLAFLWIYQGLVPKILFPNTGELDILIASGVFPGREPLVVALIGLAQIIFGLLFLFLPTNKRLHQLNIISILFLGIGALISQPDIYLAPFNPATLNLAMITLSAISLINNRHLPTARNCLRNGK